MFITDKTSTRSSNRGAGRGRLASALCAAAIGGAALVGSAPAQAADLSDWEKLAACESGENWDINTGNGYYGGLQFNLTAWKAVGGSGYPHQASKAEQIARAEKLQDIQGWGAWPACSKKTGLSGKDTKAPAFTLESATSTTTPVERSAVVTPVAPKSAPKPATTPVSKPTTKPAAKPAPTTTSGTTITVAAGDSLWKLAAKHEVVGGWKALYEANAETISNPAALSVGQKLTLPGTTKAATKPAAPSTTTGTTITVAAGDSLWKLAAKHEVVGGWRALHQANQSVVSNPDMLYVGQELVLPAR